ncbi:uncharacterized protein FA14DRAFT_169743 [Meira miltonrushii]|uniref:Uncharacterized protein n=1 Tax=Meira miltonrushii TaxID=1280837 RepID=A0A316VGX9_9BASI|nr:uncharacterized protein FA14DRAFT_169743 [Meira miltonrushii]PWN36796.1 hypothetical protein FA14DRAFT_169743 [Meira miltonrushii]
MTTTQTPFPSLPEELIKLIFEHACIKTSVIHTNPNQSRDGDIKAKSPVDVATTRSIMLVSRAAYNLVIPLLYRSITISKPSHLIKFSHTLLTRPSLGLYVRNLWVGAITAPTLNFLPIVISDVDLSIAARAHISRFENAASKRSEKPQIFFETTTDLVYVENGVEYAAMNVPSHQDRLVEVRQEYSGNVTPTSNVPDDSRHGHHTSQSSHGRGYGVDRSSLGYDAAGDWIGLDEWVLRCLEVQYAIEFHWEWVGVTTPPLGLPSPDMVQADQDVLRQDPLDWGDSNVTVAPLPSREREFSTDTLSSSSTSDFLRSNASMLGFNHIRRFFLLRAKGYSPRSAANALIDEYLASTTPFYEPKKRASDVCNLHLLTDEDEMDHFLHPALFARSGAIHLVLAGEPPEGFNAPPNAIPATTANTFAFHDEDGSEDDSSEDESMNGHRDDRQRRQRRETLDFVDLFGHIQGSSRTLYPNNSSENSESSETEDIEFAQYGQTLRPDDHIQAQPRPYSLQPGSTRTVQAIDRRPASTLGSLTANLRAALALCPRIRVLGLNGFLERAIGGTRDCAGLTELRHLSLGPPPPYWSSALNLHQKTLKSLRSLHISGCMLFKSEALAIGGFTSALPKLREVDWTLWLGHLLDHPIDVVEALSCLMGKENGSANATGRVSNQTRRSEAHSTRKPLRKIRATLNAQDVDYFQKNASLELREDPRLLLRQCASIDAEPNLLFVRQWWESKAGIITKQINATDDV